MIGMKMLCSGWCRNVMSCLLFECNVMVVVWMFCHDLWMLCHVFCVDVMSCLLFVCYVMICVLMLRHALCVDVLS